MRELGADPLLGGDRNPADPWDFYDVTGDRRIDLNDTLLILEHFGHAHDGDVLDPLLDRYAPDLAKPYRTASSTDGLGIDLTDALTNLASFGHDCN